MTRCGCSSVSASSDRIGVPGERFERVDLARGLPVGDPVPDLRLPTLDGGETVHLADFTGERPVALIFGSYT